MRLKTDSPSRGATAAAHADDAFPIAQRDERRLDRRRFLCAAGSVAVLAVGGELAAKRRLAGSDERALAVQVAPGGLPAVGEATVVASSDGREALIVQLDADAPPVAFDRRCPHLGCPVLWAAERSRFECPCHHAAFDARTGDVLFGPPRRGLAPATVTKA